MVGKGRSLVNIKKKHFGKGPVITINQAIEKVEDLELDNPIYSLQKNGGDQRTNIPKDNLSPDCLHECLDICGNMIRPQGATLLVHNLESLYCFRDYSPRYVFKLEDFGLIKNTCSFVIAIKMGELFGCSSFNFISFDAHVFKNDRTYAHQLPEVKPFYKDLDIKWIIP